MRYIRDGPGGSRMIREKKVPYRLDWEAVLGPVRDFSETRPGVDKSKVVLFGYSMGGYLCARASQGLPLEPSAKVLKSEITEKFHHGLGW